METTPLPGWEIVQEGLSDLRAGRETVASLLVSIGAPRLRQLGLELPPPFAKPEHRLYEHLALSGPTSAHARYNALLRRLVSFERAFACARLADSDRIHQFMRALGAEADADVRVYLTGGATAVLHGWRDSTIDVDIKIVPDADAVFRAIPALKERLRINVELAAPDDFIPVREGWEDRSPFIVREGRVSFHHFDLYAQALAKIERGHAQDALDVRELFARGLVDRVQLVAYFDAIEPRLYRYPAIDPAAFRQAVADAVRSDSRES